MIITIDLANFSNGPVAAVGTKAIAVVNAVQAR